MKATYLIELIEEFCKEHNFDLSHIYEEMANIYQNTYGVNIVLEMQNAGYNEMPEYLESREIVERYVTILNGMKRCIKNGWRY